MPVPVVCIDGPSGTGKGTLARLLANHLGWHLLDSGALYRLTALGAERKGIKFIDINGLSDYARAMDVHFSRLSDESVELDGVDVTDLVRLEESGEKASIVAAIPEVRSALLDRQRAFQQPPGLVADGRDMGTVVFPQAPYKIFLTASAKQRAERRYKQLKNKDVDVNLRDLLQDIEKRDRRDSERAVSPLKPAGDAITIDTTLMSIEDVFARVLKLLQSEEA